MSALFTFATKIVDPAGTGQLTVVTGSNPSVQLPVIAVSPTAPQCGVGTIVLVRTDEICPCQILDPSGNPFDTVQAPGAKGWYATAELTWVPMPPMSAVSSIVSRAAVGSGGATLAFGSANVPTGLLGQPLKFAGFAPILDAGLNVYWFPVWQ